MPNHLNTNNFVSLIGVLDIYSKYFIPEYILIYNLEDNRQKHLESISNKLETYLNSLQFKNDCEIITLENSSNFIGTIIKYNNREEDYNNGENQFDNNFNIDKPYLKDNFSSPPKIGLENIGEISYMNAILKCFCHIDKFVKFFKYNKERIDVFNDEKILSNSFKILIENLCPNKFNSKISKKFYSLYNFKEKISILNPSLFKELVTNNPKNLVNFIISQMHSELNMPNKEEISLKRDERNLELSYRNFLREYENNYKSIISDLFYAFNCNVTQCESCEIQCYNFQIYSFIAFSLEEILKYNLSKKEINKNILNYNNNFNKCSNILTMPLQNQSNNNYMCVQQNQFNYNCINMQQNQINDNYMYIQQNQFDNKFMNLQQNLTINNFINNQQNYMNNPQNQMNMNYMNIQDNMYNINPNIVNTQNNLNDNNFINMTMPQIQMNPFYNQQNSNNNINNNEVNIYDCFEFKREIKYMTGDNQIYCNCCQRTCDFKVCNNLETGPEILIIFIKREKNKNSDIKFNFCECLNLDNYIENKNKILRYKLIGVINEFSDNNNMEKSYIAFCLDPIIHIWLKYNDENIDNVENFKKEVVDSGKPHVLFYQREL